MALSDYTPATKAVHVKGEHLFDVRGLGVDDLSYIINLHREDVIAAAQAYRLQKASLFSTRGLEQMTITLLTKFPSVAAEVISAAADDRAAADRAAKLPFSSQATALHEIVAMTFEDAGGLKNLFATLASLAQELIPAELKNALLESLQSAQHPTKTA